MIKNESTLCKKRFKRQQQFNCWIPTIQELWQVIWPIWLKILKEDKDSKNLDIIHRVRLTLEPYKKSKYYDNLGRLFAEFKGQAFHDSLIIIYYQDILDVNICQKDLIKTHIYFILKHELNHWFGISHEQIPRLKKELDFHYPDLTK